MSYVIKQSSTQCALLFFMTDEADHISGLTGLSPTVTISKNGAAFGSPAGSVTEISSGWYKVAGNATDTNTLGPLALHATATGADPCDMIVGNVVAFDAQDSVRLGLTALPNAAAEASGGLVTRGTSTGQISVSSGAVLVQSGTSTGQISLSSGLVRLSATGVDDIWDEALSGHSTPGTAGDALDAAGSAGDPWSTALPGAYGSGTAGKIVGDNLNATVSSRLASASITLSGGAVTVGTNNDKTGYRLSATGVDDILDEVVEGSATFRQFLRGFGAALLGKASGAGTTTITFRNAANTKDVIIATVDASGNRSAITLDLT